MEPGGPSGAVKPDEELWAKLVTSSYPDVEINLHEMIICSEIMPSSFIKYEWCKITRSSDRCSATVQNIRSNTIIVDGEILEKEETKVISCGSEIISGLEWEGYLTYRFELIPTLEHRKNQLQISLDIELVTCKLCSKIWNDVVTVSPCFHHFCNQCFSEWIKSENEDASVHCPQCQAVVNFTGKVPFFHRIEKDILKNYALQMHSTEEAVRLEEYASTNSNLILWTGRKGGKRTARRKRPYSPQDKESDAIKHPCPQCGTKLGGFQCDQTTAHLQCQACWGMMPSRTDIMVPQHCIGCGGSFCWAYWQAEGVVTSETHTVCGLNNFKPIGEHSISRIPLLTHESNQFEQIITKLCIKQTGKTLQEVISDLVLKLMKREIDRTRMPLNHAERMTIGTHLCNDCYERLASFLLYWFRITAPKDLSPPEYLTRQNCWYGYACYTQHNTEDHARKRNHVCHPTRGSNA